ncbi:MAG: prepilin-type N-terminal cleavage/methylation domain-containing protein [Clostridium sp.]|jgi:prepilin-type N-terminal cleavage/methylation domain-containing protein
MRKGFTLIEMVIVISIMSIIGGCSVFSFRYFKTLKNKIELDYYCNAVVSFINNSKMYSRENHCDATITFDIIGNQMRLIKEGNMVNKLIFSEKITLYDVTGRRSNNDIVTDNIGYSNDSCTIILKDNNSIEHKITMRVGTAYVKIYK